MKSHSTTATLSNDNAATGPVATEPRTYIVATQSLPLRKRALDIACAAPALLLLLPVIVVLATVASLKFRASPLFSQPRLGHGGKIFRFWKVRSLPSIAPDTADKYQLAALDLPRFSRVVRTRHLDELPQLFLVLRGKMSLVGPRPEMPTLANSFDHEFVERRLSVRPGCTGLWQVSTSSRKLIGENPEFDLYYIKNWTLRLDMWVLYRTVHAIVARDEIENLGDIPRWTGAALR